LSQLSRSQRRALERAARTRREPAPWIRPRIAIAGVVMAGLAAWFVWRWIGNPDPIREGSPAWAPDSRRLAYYAEQPDGHADLFVRERDGRHVVQLTRTPADEGGPSWSPDGTQIAFDSDRDGNFEIYAMPAAPDAAARRLTSHPGRDLAPAWSPDGRTIAFMSDRDSRPEFDIFLMDADGSNVRRLTPAPSAWFPQFSPDGTRLAFHLGRDVHVLDIATRQVRRLTTDPQNGMYPTWNPDGTQLAFMTWRGGPTEIFTMGVDGSEQARLVGMPSGSAIDPRWSPDGRHIAFVSVPEESVQASQHEFQQRVIYVIELATGRMRRLHR
jgi:Tol biopolymer transport system component